MDHTEFYLQIPVCVSFISVHQIAPPLTEVGNIRLQLTTHLSIPKGWKAELAWLVDLYRTLPTYKWSPVSYTSLAGAAGQGKFADQRPTFVNSKIRSNLAVLKLLKITGLKIRPFRYASPCLWNQLPIALRQSHSGSLSVPTCKGRKGREMRGTWKAATWETAT